MGFLPNLFKLPGSGYAASAQQGMNNITQQAADTYNQQMPGILQGIAGLYTPGSPLYQQLNTDYQRNLASGLNALQQAYLRRGLGASSYLGNNMANYAAGLLDQTTRRRADLALQGLQALSSLIAPQQQVALSGYAKQYQNANQQGQQFLQGLDNLYGKVNWAAIPGAGPYLATG